MYIFCGAHKIFRLFFTRHIWSSKNWALVSYTNLFQFQQEISAHFFVENCLISRCHLYLPQMNLLVCDGVLYGAIFSVHSIKKVNHVVYDGGRKSNRKGSGVKWGGIRIDLNAAHTHNWLHFCVPYVKNTHSVSFIHFVRSQRKGFFLFLFQFCIEMQM